MGSTTRDTADGAPQKSGRRSDVDTDTEDGRAFLQERLSLFGRWCFSLVLAFYMLANLPLDAWMGKRDFSWVHEWLGYKELLTLGMIAVTGSMWALTRGKALSAARLLWIDALGVVTCATLAAAILLELAPVEGQVFRVFVILLIFSNLLTIRAIVIPSTVKRTLAISVLAFLPVVLGVFYSIVQSDDLSGVKAAHIGVAPIIWGGIAVASAVAAASILFRLRGQVSRAAKLGHYYLEEEIGQGGMGVVYKARHTTLRRATAIKLLSPERNQEEDLRRFELEVQWTANLSHPNTVAVYDYGRTPEGVFYCVMEYVDGFTLQYLVDTWGEVPPGRVVHILRQVCGALAEAHAEGIIHRDVKPANIMLCERGRVPDVAKVLDFGLVKDTSNSSEDPELSAIGSVIGTPAYLSPEAIEDPTSIDLRSDIYALGAVGYLLLTGTRLFTGETPVALCVKHLTEEPEQPSTRLGRELPSDLEDVILQCLEKDPSERPADAVALADALSACACASDWTDKDARSWWSEHGNMSKRPKGKGRGKAMAIDMTRRTPRSKAGARKES